MMTVQRVVSLGGALLSVVVLRGLTVSAAAQQVTLQYHWTKGEDLTYRFAQETTTSMSGLAGGVGDVNVGIRTSQVIRTRVDDVTADGTATLNYTYQSARWELTSPMGTTSYDTAAPTDTPPGDAMTGMVRDMLTALIGESFVVVMSRQGEVRKVDGMSRLMEKMFKDLPPNPEVQTMLQGLKNFFSDAGMRAAFSQAYGQFPDRPLKQGETWETQSTVPMPTGGQLFANMAFTLTAFEGSGAAQVAKIRARMNMKPDQASGAFAPMGLKLEFGDSTGEGDLSFAIAAGRLLGGSMRTTVPMSMTRTGPDGSAMNLRSIVQSTITVDLVRP
jgi:hypothetical protein